MSEYYFNSNEIQVFPCANRNADEPSKFTTEYNLTHLGSLRTLIISSIPNNGKQLILCWVNGYYFKFICNPDAPGFPGGNNLYLLVYISDNTNFPASVAQQGKLVPFDGKTALDQDGKFYGARLTDEPPTYPALILKNGGVWQIATIPSYLRIRAESGVIYQITVDNTGKVQVEAEVQ